MRARTAAKLVIIGVVVYPHVKRVVNETIEIKVREETKREKIKADLYVSLEAVETAKNIMLEKIKRGDYDGQTPEQMLSDMHFLVKMAESGIDITIDHLG